MRKTQKTFGVITGFAFVAVVAVASVASAQVTQTTGIPPSIAGKIDSKTPTTPPPPPIPDYVIGPDDVLTINVWKEPDVSGDVIVRPDGKIVLRFGQEIVAAGLRPEELRDKITKELGKIYQDPVPAVTIQI